MPSFNGPGESTSPLPRSVFHDRCATRHAYCDSAPISRAYLSHSTEAISIKTRSACYLTSRSYAFQTAATKTSPTSTGGSRARGRGTLANFTLQLMCQACGDAPPRAPLSDQRLLKGLQNLAREHGLRLDFHLIMPALLLALKKLDLSDARGLTFNARMAVARAGHQLTQLDLTRTAAVRRS
eukprot:scaffold131657_cov17-Prasinocladus_malaysianus.AAC.1